MKSTFSASLSQMKALATEIVSMTLVALTLSFVLRISGFYGPNATFIWTAVFFALIVINAIAITTAIVRYVWTGRAESMSEFEVKITGHVHNDPLVVIGLKSVVFLAILYLVTRPV